MNDTEMKQTIEIFHAVHDKIACTGALSCAVYIGVGLSFVAYPGTPDDRDQPRRDLFIEALGFQRCDEHGTPIHPQSCN